MSLCYACPATFLILFLLDYLSSLPTDLYPLIFSCLDVLPDLFRLFSACRFLRAQVSVFVNHHRITSLCFRALSSIHSLFLIHLLYKFSFSLRSISFDGCSSLASHLIKKSFSFNPSSPILSSSSPPVDSSEASSSSVTSASSSATDTVSASPVSAVAAVAPSVQARFSAFWSIFSLPPSPSAPLFFPSLTSLSFGSCDNVNDATLRPALLPLRFRLESLSLSGCKSLRKSVNYPIPSLASLNAAFCPLLKVRCYCSHSGLFPHRVHRFQNLLFPLFLSMLSVSSFPPAGFFFASFLQFDPFGLIGESNSGSFLLL